MADDKKLPIDRKEQMVIKEKAVQAIYAQMPSITSGDFVEIVKKGFIFGIPIPELAPHFDMIEKYVIAHKFAKLEKRPISAASLGRPGWECGGPFVDYFHIHIREDVYALSANQFQILAKDIAKETRIDLEKAAIIKF